MKIAKTRFDYIFFIYVPFALVGILLNGFFQNSIVSFLKGFMLFTLVFALICIVAPFSKQKPLANDAQQPTAKIKNWFGRLLLLQFSVILTFIAFSQAVIHFIISNQTHLTSSTLLQQTTYFYQGGLWPWPFILLVSCALAYLGKQQKQPAILRNAVQPVIKKHADGIIGVGIEIFLKQGLLFSVLLTIGMLCLQFAHIISQLLQLPGLLTFSLHTSVIGICIFILLAKNKFTQSLTRQLWQQKFADQKIILIFCGVTISALIIINLLLYLITHYLFATQNIKIPLPAINIYNNIHLWLLLSFIWWLGIMPLLTNAIAIIMREQSLRTILSAGLILPILLFLIWQVCQYYLPNSQSIINCLTSWPIALILGIMGLISTALLFQNPNICNITTSGKLCSPAEYSTVTFLRSLWQLCTFILVAYLLTNLNFITYLGAALTAPIFATLFSSILSCVLTIKKKASRRGGAAGLYKLRSSNL